MQHVSAVVVDEAYCVSQWGENFRKKFGEFGQLLSVPFLAASATMSSHVYNDVRRKLCFPKSWTYLANLGNEKLNITPIICHMHGGAKDLVALNFVIDEAISTPQKRLIHTMIFFNTQDLAYKGCKHLQNIVPPKT